MRRIRSMVPALLAGSLACCPAAAQPADGGRDGSSVERAVIIDAERDVGAPASERAWIQAHFPGWTVKRQALVGRAGRKYDLITIVSPRGEQRDVYFDITRPFGRM